jgi:hypothetical protein
VSTEAEATEASPAADEHTSTVGGHTITVSPRTFTMVDYEAADIARVAGELCERVGLPPGLAVRIVVDQTTPLGRAYVVSSDPAVLSVESGALEDNLRPRQFHEENSAQVFGRLLLKVRDRLDPAFGDAPADDELTLELAAAWDAYATGRLARLGYDINRQRRIYQFRVRHGFSDEADAVFAKLWGGDGLSWKQIAQLSADAKLDG